MSRADSPIPRAPTRKRFLVAGSVFASIGLLRYPAGAAEFSYKLANDQPATHPLTSFAEKAAKAVLDASSGRLEIHVFSNSALGNDTQMIAQARSGALELLQIGNNILANVIPAAALEGIPFAFNSYSQMESASNGALGSYIGAQAERIGLRKFDGSWYGGTFQVENRVRAIDVPADFKGLKIRVPAGPLDVSLFKAFDAAPTVVSLAEVYTSLQTHLVDGIEVPLPTLENFRFFEQIKYVSLTGHSFLNYLMVANAAAWQRLPKSLQEIVDREFLAASTQASAAMAADEDGIETKLRSQGLVFNRPAVEPFRQVVRSAGLYAQWRDQYDSEAWKILSKTTGDLA
jgi:tripartite ATP-independent transporter DctP family solute receptor